MLLRQRLIIAVAIAALITSLASWLTSGQFDPVGGKPLFVGALIVLPLVVAAKNGLTGLAATALAFTTYFAFAFLGVWLATRKKRVRS
jgi:hypothetical protein